MEDLYGENYIIFAAKYYWSIHYTTKEFISDLKRVTYIKRLILRYLKTGELQERLILNHLILLFNVFDPQISVQKMLFLKHNKKCYSALKTFLLYLNYLPNELEVNSKLKILLTEIPVDMFIADKLRNL